MVNFSEIAAQTVLVFPAIFLLIHFPVGKLLKLTARDDLHQPMSSIGVGVTRSFFQAMISYYPNSYTARGRGSADLAALGPYKNDRGPIFPSTARASSVSK